jgi:hypothetical protein
MQLSASREPRYCSATHKICSILWNLKVHYCVHKRLPLVSILRQLNLPPTYFFKTCCWMATAYWSGPLGKHCVQGCGQEEESYHMNEFSASHEFRQPKVQFIITRVHQWTLSWGNWIKSTPSYPTSLLEYSPICTSTS